MGEGHVSDAELIEHPQNSKAAGDGVARLNSDETGNFLLGKGILYTCSLKI